jgi:hypothetical protein
MPGGRVASVIRQEKYVLWRGVLVEVVTRDAKVGSPTVNSHEWAFGREASVPKVLEAIFLGERDVVSPLSDLHSEEFVDFFSNSVFEFGSSEAKFLNHKSILVGRLFLCGCSFVVVEGGAEAKSRGSQRDPVRWRETWIRRHGPLCGLNDPTLIHAHLHRRGEFLAVSFRGSKFAFGFVPTPGFHGSAGCQDRSGLLESRVCVGVLLGVSNSFNFLKKLFKLIVVRFRCRSSPEVFAAMRALSCAGRRGGWIVQLPLWSWTKTALSLLPTLGFR